MLLTGAVLLPTGIVRDGAVVVAGERILFAGRREDVPPQLASAPPAEGWEPGLTLLPGLVDIHCHGGGGGEFGAGARASTDGVPATGDRLPGAAARAAATHHHRAGSTTVVGSLVSASASRLLGGIRACAPLVASGELAGLHLEGPFLSVARCGAQDPAALVAPDIGLVRDLASAAGLDGIAHWTFAPELPGADRLPGVLADLGILGAVGHTDADASTARTALSALAARPVRGGRPLVTHVFNGMPPLLSRAPGPVGAAISAAGRGEAVLEVIADGVHLDGATVQLLFDTVGPGGIALVSDCMSAAGLPEGRYTLGGRSVRVSGRQVRLADSGSLAGSVSSLLDEVRWCVVELGIPLEDAVQAAAGTPAAALHLHGAGSLAAGAWADVLAVDDSLELRHVMRRGRALAPLPG